MERQTTETIITLTEKAAAKVKQMLKKENNENYGLRLGVVAGGCSGYMYEIQLEKEAKENDLVIEDKGIKIFINPESIAFMKGSTLDYKDGLQNAGFKIENPNVKRTCGCGHSVG
ncbi:MAG: iron-sulfur cluster assembly accessory protein [Nanoarchaeota archaeon]